MVQIIQGGVKRPSSTEGFMQSLAPAATQAFDDYYKMSLADKMEGLKIQRKQEADLAQRMNFSKAARSKGHNLFADLIEQGVDPDKAAQIEMEQASMNAYNNAILKDSGYDVSGNTQQETPYQNTDQELPQEAEGESQQISSQRGLPAQASSKKILPPGITGKQLPQYLAQQRAQEGLAIQDRRAKTQEEKLAFAKTKPERDRLEKENERIDTLRRSTRTEDMASSVMENAIKNDNLGMLSLNNLAMQFNQPGLLSADAAAFNAAKKELFVGGLASIPGSQKLNMWIEQQVSSMIPQIGISEPAALSMLEITNAKTNLNRKDVQLHDELEQKYPDDPKTFLREKNKQLDEYAIKLQKQTAYNIQKIKEDDQRRNNSYEFNSMKTVMPGTPLTLEKARIFLDKAKGDKNKAIKMALHFGYDVYTSEQGMKK